MKSLLEALKHLGNVVHSQKSAKTGQYQLIPSGIEARLDRAQGTAGRAIQPKECAGADFLARHSRLCLLASFLVHPQELHFPYPLKPLTVPRAHPEIWVLPRPSTVTSKSCVTRYLKLLVQTRRAMDD